MLTVFNGSDGYPISNDDYYIRELSNGLDEVVFEISLRDPVYKYIVEEAKIRDRDENVYIIKQIDAGNERVKVVAQIDIDAWKSTIYEKYTNDSATVYATVLSVLPTGWSCINHSNITIRRTIPTSDTTTDYNVTAWKVLQDCCNVYGVRFRFDSANKIVTIVNPKLYENVGAFVTRDLNLRELNFKGKSTDLCTRLYAEGADGLTFASINDNKNYIENFQYTNKVISMYWKDERYTDAQSLLADATSKLDELSKPSRSYDCDVLDLANTNPELYGFEDFSLFNVITLIDDAAERRLNYQIVERWNYPHYPVQNKVVLSTETPKIQNQVVALMDAVKSPTSEFQQIMQSAIMNSTALITGNKGGYVVLHDSDNDGEPDEILIMDTPSISTAQKVWRWNSGGLGYSSTGYNGNFSTAITANGAIVADFITAGTLNGGIIRAGSVEASALSVQAKKEFSQIHSYLPIDVTTNLNRWNNSSEMTPAFETITVDGVEKQAIVVDGTHLTEYSSSRYIYTKTDLAGNLRPSIKFKMMVDRTVTGLSQQDDLYFVYYKSNGHYYEKDWGMATSYEANRVYEKNLPWADTSATIDPSYRAWLGFYPIPNAKYYVFDYEVTAPQGSYVESTLQFTADGLNTVVSRGDIISSINQSAESVTINASKIDLTGNLSLHGDFVSNGTTPWGTTGESRLNAGRMIYLDDGKQLAKLEAVGLGNYDTASWIFNDTAGNFVAEFGAWTNVKQISIQENLYNNGQSHFWGAVTFEADVYNRGGHVVFTSDRRKKKNIRALITEKAKAFIMALRPCAFKFKDGTSNRNHHGFIAQEVKEAMNEDWGLYVENKEMDFIGLRYDEIIADLVCVVQEQEKRIEALERIINDKSDN